MKEVESNHGGALKDPLGHPLPPFMVMERGESLDIWSTRSKPDRTLAFGVRLRCNITAPAVSAASYCFLVLTATKRPVHEPVT